MNDMYKEILIKRRKTSQDTLIAAGMIALVVLFAFVGLFMIPAVLILALAAIFACVYVIPGLNKEYEYIYCNGEFDIDLIRAKQRRKRVASYDLEHLELVAPSSSHDLDPYRQKQGVVIKDYTSLEPDAKSYTFVYQMEKGTTLVLMEVDESVIKDIRRLAPRKISRECMLMLH